jgi:hypothetical protein
VDQVQIHLVLFTAMLKRRQQPGIVGGEAGQLLRIVAIVLRFAGGDGADLACVGHDHLVAQSGEQAADPGRVRATFQGNAHARLGSEMPSESCFRALYAPSSGFITATAASVVTG